VSDLSERLLRSDGAYWSFYSRGDVERLAADLRASPPR